MGCGAKYATGVTTASIWRFWNICVKGTAEAMDKVEKMLNCFSAADPEIFQIVRGGGGDWGENFRTISCLFTL